MQKLHNGFLPWIWRQDRGKLSWVQRWLQTRILVGYFLIFLDKLLPTQMHCTCSLGFKWKCLRLPDPHSRSLYFNCVPMLAIRNYQLTDISEYISFQCSLDVKPRLTLSWRLYRLPVCGCRWTQADSRYRILQGIVSIKNYNQCFRTYPVIFKWKINKRFNLCHLRSLNSSQGDHRWYN